MNPFDLFFSQRTKKKIILHKRFKLSKSYSVKVVTYFVYLNFRS